MKSSVFTVYTFVATAVSLSMINSAIAVGLQRVRRSTACSSAALPSSLTQALKDGFLAAHNTARGRVVPIAANMAKMAWDDNLARAAQWSANQCKFEHNNHKNCKVNDESVGQNIHITTSTAVPDTTAVVDSWDAEKHDYTYVPNSNGTCSDVCGHYTQVAWATSRKVGCAYKTCSNVNVNGENWSTATITFCNYGPAGNMVGKAPYVSGNSSCSQCETTNGYLCENNLCVVCLPENSPPNACTCDITECENGGTFDSGKCKCTCTSDYYGRTCSDECKDASPFCNQWTEYCSNPSYLQFMTDNCYKTCGFC